MADTLARMRQLIGSTAEWTANDIVLGYGELGIERVSASEYKAKVGDGTSRYSMLPYLSTVYSGINAATQAAINGKLSTSGGTMTGDLVLAHSAVNPFEPVTLAQLQGEIVKLNTVDTGKVSISGDTMTGPLTLASGAVAPFQPVTLEQAQKLLSYKIDETGGIMKGGLFLKGDATTPLEAVTFDQLTRAINTATIGGVSFKGLVDATATYAAPTPAPGNGSMYTATKAGPLDASWTSHIVNPPASISVGDQFIWNATANKFDFIAASASLPYVPLTGTTGMGGTIGWGGAANSQNGKNIIDGKGGKLADVVIDEGAY